MYRVCCRELEIAGGSNCGLSLGCGLGFAIECNATWIRFHPELLKRTRFAELHQIGFRHVRLAIRPRDDEPLDCGERRPMQLVGIRTKPVKPENVFPPPSGPSDSANFLIKARSRRTLERKMSAEGSTEESLFHWSMSWNSSPAVHRHKPFQIMPRNKHGFCRCILFRPSNATPAMTQNRPAYL